MRALTCILTLAGLLAGNIHAADKPLRALLITGGFCHDYAKEKDILNPTAIVAQVFDTYSFTLEDNSVHLGFVTLESADTISIHNAAGVAAELPVKQIKKREKIPASSMPPGLVAGLTPEQLADLLAYLDTI